jgi:hypothetical protein
MIVEKVARREIDKETIFDVIFRGREVYTGVTIVITGTAFVQVYDLTLRNMAFSPMNEVTIEPGKYVAEFDYKGKRFTGEVVVTGETIELLSDFTLAGPSGRVSPNISLM